MSHLAVLDGAYLPNEPSNPVDVRMAKWVAALDKVSQSKARGYRTVEEAAERMKAHNRRLTAEQALHLATHAVRENADGMLSWKYDPYQRVRAPYRLTQSDYIGLWSRITCPTLFLCASESFIPDPEKGGILTHFRQAHQKIVAGAAHWLQHDRLDEVLAELRVLLDMPES